MKVLITGASGQLGQALARIAPHDVQLLLRSHSDLDISDAKAVTQLLETEQVELIVNAAAYTAVDKAESDRTRAVAVNTDGPRHLAQSANAFGARLIHVSTDFVFDGKSSKSYETAAPLAPLNVYGETKAEGERAIAASLAAHAIVRTSWVYAPWGANFVLTMLRLMRERGSVRVVADQIGRPTSALSLARAVWNFAGRPDLVGTFHWADAGVASWYDLAVAIAEEAAVLGILPVGIKVLPIASEEYPTPARRPRFSVLDTRSTSHATGMQPAHWRVELREVLRSVAHA